MIAIGRRNGGDVHSPNAKAAGVLASCRPRRESRCSRYVVPSDLFYGNWPSRVRADVDRVRGARFSRQREERAGRTALFRIRLSLTGSPRSRSAVAVWRRRASLTAIGTPLGSHRDNVSAAFTGDAPSSALTQIPPLRAQRHVPVASPHLVVPDAAISSLIDACHANPAVSSLFALEPSD